MTPTRSNGEERDTAAKHPWLGQTGATGGIGRAELKNILGDLKVLFETIEVGDANALREVHEKGEQGKLVVDELQQLLTATHDKLTALRELFDQIVMTAGDEGPSTGSTSAKV